MPTACHVRDSPAQREGCYWPDANPVRMPSFHKPASKHPGMDRSSWPWLPINLRSHPCCRAWNRAVVYMAPPIKRPGLPSPDTLPDTERRTYVSPIQGPARTAFGSMCTDCLGASKATTISRVGWADVDSRGREAGSRGN